MVRVLHVTNAFPYEGSIDYGVFIKEQIEAARDLGVESETVFINGREGGKKAYLKSRSKIHELAQKYDVVHCHHLYSGLATALALTGKPSVLSFLTDWPYEAEGINSMMARTLLCTIGVHWADRVIFKSPVPKHLTDPKKFINLPNGVDETHFGVRDRGEARRRLGLDQDAIYLLFVSSKGYHRPQKRYDVFTATRDQLNERAGYEKYRELLLVKQPRDVVIDYFAAADVHLLSSDFEGSPNSVKEALCCGLPVVSRDVGNVRDMLEGLPRAVTLDSADPNLLADAVEDVLGQSADREAVRAAFLAKGLDRHSITRRLVGIYEELARGAQR